jgi:aspartyl/asparaginyl beta-hydroxylase (cupin superfamily)
MYSAISLFVCFYRIDSSIENEKGRTVMSERPLMLRSMVKINQESRFLLVDLFDPELPPW